MKYTNLILVTTLLVGPVATNASVGIAPIPNDQQRNAERVVEATSAGRTIDPLQNPALSTAAGPSHPLLFIPNHGQFDARARFQAHALGGTLWIAEDGIWLTVTTDKKTRRPGDKGVNLRLTFPGMNPAARLTGLDPQPARMNYLRGGDRDHWQANVPTFGAVRWENVYPGADLVIGDQWVVVSHDPLPTTHSPLHLQVQGADQVRVNADGELIADTAIGPIPLPRLSNSTGQPLLASIDPGPGCHPATQPPSKGQIGNLPSLSPCLLVSWSPGHPVTQLSSHPAAPAITTNDSATLEYGTYLGGSGSNYYGGAEHATSIAVDSSGNAYVTGLVDSSDYPTTPGAFDTTYNGGYLGQDAFVTKLNPSGTAPVYSTFLGGTNDECLYDCAIAVDASGSAYVTGDTKSYDFPVTTGAYSGVCAGSRADCADVFVTKLSADGASLVYSSYLGGTGLDYAYGIAVDANGAAYVTGNTESSDFPTTAGTYDNTLAGTEDAFVTQFNPDGASLGYSTYLGGTGASGDNALGIAVDSTGSAYVTGWTSSTDFPTTAGAYSTTLRGTRDAFITKLNPTGTGLTYSTFLGGSSNFGEYASSIAVDSSGSAYVTGQTASSDYPTTPGVLDRFYSGHNDVIVTKLHPDGSSLDYSTFLGGNDSYGEAGLGIAVASDGSAYVTGWTTSADLSTTPNAYDATYNGANDGFVTIISPAGTFIRYSTFLAGIHDDYGYSIAVDAAGLAYIAGMTFSPDFPTTPTGFDPTYNGAGDGWAAKLNGVLVPTGTTIDDSSIGANDNGYPEPGETGIALYATLINWGPTTTTNASAHLTALTPGVTVTTDTAQYPDFVPNQSVTNLTPFYFSISPDVACGPPIQFRLDVTTDQAVYSLSFRVSTGIAQSPVAVFTDNVENGANGWTTGGTHNTWAFTTDRAHSPTHSWADSPGGNYVGHTNSYLQSPVFNLSGKYGTTFAAWYNYSIACCGDFFFVEYSLNGGLKWEQTPLTSAVGNSPGWIRVNLNTSVLDNQPNVRIRYRLTTDNTRNSDGMYIDDINLSYTPYVCDAPTARMHVASIDPSFDRSGGRYNVRSSFTIQDVLGLPVPGATITATVTKPRGTVTTFVVTTDASGQATYSFTTLVTGTYTFTVIDVTKPGWTYDPSQNVETSDSILVQ